MCPWVRPFLAGLYDFFENRSEFAKIWQKIVACELKIWEIFLKSPRFPAPEAFLRNRLNVEIYTDSCARSPFESESIIWDSGIGIGGILVTNGDIVEFFALEVNERIPHWLKGLKSPRRLISFFEHLGAYLGI